MTFNKGIPTEYGGVRFRSRVEARWAAFFDQLRWPWEYEPLDLDGYIPDFLLQFPYEPVVVEVKHEVRREVLEQHSSKIKSSGWKGEWMIVGATLFPSTQATGEGFEACTLGLMNGWSGALLRNCSGPGRGLERQPVSELCLYGLGDDLGSFHCRRCGAYNGGSPMEHSMATGLFEWRQSSNRVQWRRPA